ncbi:2-oxo acid dehydrogenase subunit E2 [Agromyces sp. C10]|uniref:2-oxo acid dehydrogenase subunit E2 n=1 Tax=Agromyces sp. C10 TaxID=2935077 RepID=UPI00200A51E7|nr:2-oxo acid dehydrogenase subunit E2 [Agromyces sp. C10]MCK8610116.1 2-oxo acid dehydrogenase subunit E2 [Agromyces sp. C10]
MSTAAPALAEGVSTPLTGIRRTAARRMVQAWQAPVFHLTVEADMTHAQQVRTVAPGATVTDVLVRAAARALMEVPEVNAHVGEDEVTVFPNAHVGIAVAGPKGLTVPVIHHAETLDLAGLAERRSDVVSRARDGALTRQDITGGTFSISNLGMMDIARFDAILNVPQAAILAVGATTQRHVMGPDGPEWRPIADLTLTCDHRALDGAAGARFLAALIGELASPLGS